MWTAAISPRATNRCNVSMNRARSLSLMPLMIKNDQAFALSVSLVIIGLSS